MKSTTKKLPLWWREKISNKMMGHKISHEVKIKIALARTGKKHSPETIEKIRKSTKRGEDSPYWKGGKTSKRMRITGSNAYKNFRTSIFIRDGFTCQMPNCKAFGKKLNCHHIEKFSENEDKVMDKENCITLCENCHRQIHFKEHLYVALFKSILGRVDRYS